MKEYFLQVIESDKKNKYYKNEALGYWGFDFEKYNIKLKKNFSYLNEKNKERLDRYKKSREFVNKINRKLFNILKKKLFFTLNYNDWKIIFYPYLINIIYSIISKIEKINKIFLKKKFKYVVIEKFSNEQEIYNFNTTYDLLDRIDDGTLSKYIILKIIEDKKISTTIKFKVYQKNKVFFSFKKFFIEIKNKITNLLAKISYNFNDIVFESFYCSKIDFLFLSLKLKIFPHKINSLFEKKFNSLYNHILRDQIINELFKEKFSKQEKLIIKILITISPKNFIENLVNIIAYYKKFKNKKYIITSIGFYYNELFRTYLMLSKKNRTKIIQCDHGGGLSSSNIPNTYVQNKLFNKFAVWGKYSNGTQIPTNKKIYMNPTLASLKKNIYLEKKIYLSIFFYESKKFTIEFDGLQSFIDQNNLFEALINFCSKLPIFIKNNLLFRPLKNYGMKSEARFHKKIMFKKNFDKNKLTAKSFIDSLQKSKIIITNLPSTVLSEAMAFNIPAILFCKPNQLLLDKRSKKLIFQMKKNKMLFNDEKKLLVHITKLWQDPLTWWNSSEVQKIRKVYLKNYFNVLDNFDNFFEKIKK